MTMSLFDDLKTTGLEESQDRLGGYRPLDTDGYEATIKLAYTGKSAKGARFVYLAADINGAEYRETIYVTNQKGENFFLNKDDKTKKVPLPGFTTVDDICLCATGKPLAEQATEEKQVKVYNPDTKTEEPKAVPVMVELLGKKVILGITKQLENKSDKVGDVYVPNADTREINFIDKVFDVETKGTVAEARRAQKGDKVTLGDFHTAWVERNQGQTRDKRTIKDGSANGSAGRPGASSPPQAGGGERKSLFK